MSKSAVRLTIKDSGALPIFKDLRMTISGGVHEEQGAAVHDQGPLSVYEVAAVNEFGGGRIPARMWLRGWVTRGEKLFVQRIRNAMVYMVRNQKYTAPPFEQIAEDLKTSIRGRILEGLIRPPNHPATLARKAPETRPLVEHGQLADAIHGRLQAQNSSGSINWKAERT